MRLARRIAPGDRKCCMALRDSLVLFIPYRTVVGGRLRQELKVIKRLSQGGIGGVLL